MDTEADYPNWNFTPQAPSSYEVHVTCQIENLGRLLEGLPKPFGVFDPDYRGTFVEVGAFDGKTYSNLIPWAGNWNGIMIEPMRENLEKCVALHKDRPWIHIEPVACGAKDDIYIPMHFEREGSRIADDLEHVPVSIKASRLDTILKKHQWEQDFDVLVVDTEDYELMVLAGFDLEYWRPKLCIVETHQPFRPLIHAVFRNLYLIYSEDGLNTLFVRRDWYGREIIPATLCNPTIKRLVM